MFFLLRRAESGSRSELADKRTPRQKGFTLVELLIGVILLAIGLLAIGSLQVTSVRGNFSSNNVTQATYIAQDGLESLINLPFGDGLLTSGREYTPDPVKIAGLTFDRRYTVIESNGLKTISYTVRWNDGINHVITVSTSRYQ